MITLATSKLPEGLQLVTLHYKRCERHFCKQDILPQNDYKTIVGWSQRMVKKILADQLENYARQRRSALSQHKQYAILAASARKILAMTAEFDYQSCATVYKAILDSKGDIMNLYPAKQSKQSAWRKTIDDLLIYVERELAKISDLKKSQTTNA